MSRELDFCPFCGEEVEWHKYSQAARRIARQNGQPLVQMIDCTNRECGATFSFNTPIKSLAKSECRKAFNTRAERTCKAVYVEQTDPYDQRWYECDFCGGYLFSYEEARDICAEMYCSTCGAKVISGKDTDAPTNAKVVE